MQPPLTWGLLSRTDSNSLTFRSRLFFSCSTVLRLISWSCIFSLALRSSDAVSVAFADSKLMGLRKNGIKVKQLLNAHFRLPAVFYLFDSTFKRLFSVCSSSISCFNLDISAALWPFFAVEEEEDQVDEVELSAGEEYHELLPLPLPLLFVDDDCVVSPHQESLLGSLDHDEVDQPELAVVVAAAAAAGCFE